MKYIITENQLDKIKDNMLTLPYSAFNDWDLLQKFINKRGNPPYILKGKIDLEGMKNITSLGSLFGVEGDLLINETSVETLGNLVFVTGYLKCNNTPLESLGNLTSVNSIKADNTQLSSLGNLTSVKGFISVRNTWIYGGGKFIAQEVGLPNDYHVYVN
jgi:hypothetical protein